MLISLQKKLVDGAVLTDPSYFIAEDLGSRVIADLAKMNMDYLQSLVVSTRNYLRANRDQATRVLCLNLLFPRMRSLSFPPREWL